MTFDKMYGHEGFLAKRFGHGGHYVVVSGGRFAFVSLQNVFCLCYYDKKSCFHYFCEKYRLLRTLMLKTVRGI